MAILTRVEEHSMTHIRHFHTEEIVGMWLFEILEKVLRSYSLKMTGYVSSLNIVETGGTISERIRQCVA